MDTGGEKDLCLFWEWAQEYKGRSGQTVPFTTYGGLAQNLIGWHTILAAVFFQKRQLMPYFGVSHWSVARTEVVKSALKMLALYMCFNGTGIWSGETICP